MVIHMGIRSREWLWAHFRSVDWKQSQLRCSSRSSSARYITEKIFFFCLIGERTIYLEQTMDRFSCLHKTSVELSRALRHHHHRQPQQTSKHTVTTTLVFWSEWANLDVAVDRRAEGSDTVSGMFVTMALGHTLAALRTWLMIIESSIGQVNWHSAVETWSFDRYRSSPNVYGEKESSNRKLARLFVCFCRVRACRKRNQSRKRAASERHVCNEHFGGKWADNYRGISRALSSCPPRQTN